jgi:hypothetical protein
VVLFANLNGGGNEPSRTQRQMVAALTGSNPFLAGTADFALLARLLIVAGVAALAGFAGQLASSLMRMTRFDIPCSPIL